MDRSPLLAATLLFGLVLPVPAAAPQDATTDRAIPGDSLLRCVPADGAFFLSVTDFGSLRDDFRSNAWVEMVMAPELAELRATIVQGAGLQSPFASREIEETARRMFEAFDGDLTMFVDGMDQEEVALVVRPRSGQAEFERFIRDVMATDEDVVVEHAVHDGIDLTVWDVEGDTGADFEFDGLWVTIAAPTKSRTIELATGIIDRYRGRGENVAGSALLASARGERAPGRIEFFVNTHRFVATRTEDTGFTELELRTMELMGIQEIEWVHGTSELGTGQKFDLRVRAPVPQRGYARAWADACKPLPTPLAHLSPKDTGNLTLGHIDVREIYEAVWDASEELDPEATTAARAQIDAMAHLLDVEEDLLGQITGAFAIFSVPIAADELAAHLDTATLDADGIPEELRTGDAWAIELEDPATVASFFQQVLATFGDFMGIGSDALRQERFGDAWIETLHVPPGDEISWSFTEGQVFFSRYPSALRAALRHSAQGEEAESVLSNGAFANEIERYESASLLYLTSSGVAAKRALGLLRMVIDGTAVLEAPLPEEVARIVLPPSEFVDEYLDGTVVASIEVSDSVLVISFEGR